MWIRIETNIDGNMKVQRLRKALGLRTPEMVGHLVILWGHVAEHNVHGNLADVDHVTIEEWAGWRGEEGLFAKSFMKEFVTADGTIESWEEYQGKLITRQLEDRDRKRLARKGRGKSSDSPPTIGSSSSVDGNDNGNGTPKPLVTENAREKPEIIRSLITALNAGMSDNPEIKDRFNPVVLTHGQSVQAAADIIAAGVPEEFARTEILERARAYRPSGRSRQINTLAYLAPAVIDAWEKQQANTEASSASRPADMPRKNSRQQSLAKPAYKGTEIDPAWAK